MVENRVKKKMTQKDMFKPSVQKANIVNNSIFLSFLFFIIILLLVVLFFMALFENRFKMVDSDGRKSQSVWLSLAEAGLLVTHDKVKLGLSLCYMTFLRFRQDRVLYKFVE